MSHSKSRSFGPIDFKTRFPALDGIRALAVTMVFALHYGGGTHGGRLLSLLNAIRLRGAIGVDLFFVLSGFLITGILYDTTSDSRYFQRFFVRRSIRIFPVFYLIFAVLLLLTPVLRYQWRPGHLAFPLYMGNFALAINPSLEQIDSANHADAAAHLLHFWSLCVEEQFYLIWPLVVWLIRDRLRLLWTAAAFCLVALALRIGFVLNISSTHNEPWMLHLLPFRMDALLMGAILALLLRGPKADSWQQYCKWFLLLATAVVVMICVLSPAIDSPWFNTLGLSAVAIASAGLIGTCLRAGSPSFRVFYLRPLRVLGRYSYGFYLYHLIWAGGWRSLVELLTLRLHSSLLANGIVISLAFVVTFLVARLSYDLFEVRFLKLKIGFEYDSELTEHRRAFTSK